MISYRFRICDFLEKIFPEGNPGGEAAGEHGGTNTGSSGYGLTLHAFWGERVSFQLAYYMDCRGQSLPEEELTVTAKSREKVRISMYRVLLAPSAYPCSGEHDEDYLSTSPGLYPDILYPENGNAIRAVHGQWRAIWFDVTPDAGEVGSCLITVEARVRGGERIWQTKVKLMVVPASLPRQKLIHTEQLHADCLADYYGIPVFSERHWEIVECFVRAAGSHGINMLYTPLFTPPMDTAEGGERTTVQLIGVEKTREEWRFDFSRLKRWIAMGRSCGMEYFEMAPLFTQWGAKAAPKITGVKSGRETRLFGWETVASDQEYAGFLRSFLPKLTEFFKAEGVFEQVWFHVSDEPTVWNMESYQKAHSIMEECLPGCRLLDALSDFELYSSGIVKHPVVSNDHLEPFIRERVPDLWTYYCCVQGVDVSNRFFSMPSCRNMILGVQLYLYGMQGFLHWGYNFYNTRYSRKHINPYGVTDCGESFPSGDAFLVYPGEDGTPVLSLRLKVLSKAMDQIRALEALEALTSREYVERLIYEEAGMEITWKQYPRKPEFLLRLHEKIHLQFLDM